MVSGVEKILGINNQLSATDGLEGDPSRVSGYFYLGYKNYIVGRADFIFAPRTDKNTVVKLSGLKHICIEDDILVILTPASKIEGVLLKKNLCSDNIIQPSLASSLNPHSFELPLDKHLVGLLKTEGIALTKKKKISLCKI